MLARLNRHFGVPGVLAVIALVFAMVGGAYAAKKYVITSTAQIKPSVLKTLKGETGPAGPAGTAGGPGTAGAAGAPGAKGDAGSPGSPGAPGSPGTPGSEGSPWTAGGTLPSGETETGSWAFGPIAISPAVESVRVAIPFTLPLSAILGVESVHFINPNGQEAIVGGGGPEEVTSTKCLGSPAAPTAVAGNLCVYTLGKTGTALAFSNFTIFKAGAAGTGASTAGAYVEFFLSETSSGAGTWAVTAP